MKNDFPVLLIYTGEISRAEAYYIPEHLRPADLGNGEYGRFCDNLGAMGEKPTAEAIIQLAQEFPHRIGKQFGNVFTNSEGNLSALIKCPVSGEKCCGTLLTQDRTGKISSHTLAGLENLLFCLDTNGHPHIMNVIKIHAEGEEGQTLAERAKNADPTNLTGIDYFYYGPGGIGQDETGTGSGCLFTKPNFMDYRAAADYFTRLEAWLSHGTAPSQSNDGPR